MKIICGIAFTLSALGSGCAIAQTSYPAQTVRVLVGFPSGMAPAFSSGVARGFSPSVPPDATARLLAARLSDVWGKRVLVENIPGAGGNTAASRLAKAPPDGYTLGMIGNHSLVFSPSLYDKLGFDPIKDFVPITQVFVATNVLVVPFTPARALPDLVALARAQPGKLSYAYIGAGSSEHLAAELFKSKLGLDIQPVAYRGNQQMTDVHFGRVSMAFCNLENILNAVQNRLVRGLAVTSARRSAIAPDLPTMRELGYHGFETVSWFGLMAPAGTPAGIVYRVHRDTVKILALPEVRKALNDLGLDVIGGTPSELAAVIEREIPQWAGVIKQAGIKGSD